MRILSIQISDFVSPGTAVVGDKDKAHKHENTGRMDTGVGMAGI
jgi:hypothetical protein